VLRRRWSITVTVKGRASGFAAGGPGRGLSEGRAQASGEVVQKATPPWARSRETRPRSIRLSRD
jgi:hypothetical protein